MEPPTNTALLVVIEIKIKLEIDKLAPLTSLLFDCPNFCFLLQINTHDLDARKMSHRNKDILSIFGDIQRTALIPIIIIGIAIKSHQRSGGIGIGFRIPCHLNDRSRFIGHAQIK